MAFVYNNKLPFHSWGVTSAALGSTGALYGLVQDYGGLKVPIAEKGAQQLWKGRVGGTANSVSINNPAKLEATPCDAQMPWKKFVSVAATVTFGLTLHGEIYAIESSGPIYGTVASQRSRRMTRIVSPLCQKPFSSLNYANSRSGSGFTYLAMATDTDGKIWWLRRISQGTRFGEWSLEEVQGPTGHKIIFASRSSVPDVYCVTTDANRSFMRQRTGTQWYEITGAAYDVARSDGVEWSAPPTVTVPAPPAGGTQAAVDIQWAESNPTTVSSITITEPGSGYTSDIQLQFSSPPITGNANDFKLKVNTEWFVANGNERAYNTTAQFIFSSGSMTGRDWSFPPPASNYNGWIPKFTFKDSAGNTIPVKHTLLSNSHVFSLSGNIYKSTSDGFVLLDNYTYKSVAKAGEVVACVRDDNCLYTFGTNGEDTTRAYAYGAYFGDDSEIGSVRALPQKIASEAEWVSVF